MALVYSAAVRVFLSSTYIDLEDERNEVYDRMKDQLDVVRMEDFGARDEVPVDTCVAEVRNCDVYVLLLGHRYGTVAPGYRASYTHVEYETARESGIPVLAYVRAGFEDALENSDDPVRLKDFYDEVRESHTLRRPFTSPTDLADQVEKDLTSRGEQLTRRPVFLGQRRRAAIDDVVPYAVKSVRHAQLQLKPYVLVVADLGVLSERTYPDKPGRRMRHKVREIVEWARSQEANALVFNQIPAPGESEIVDQRVQEVRERANLVVCLSKGAGDVVEVRRFAGGDAAIALWHPAFVNPPQDVQFRDESYALEDLQNCELALHVEEFVDAKLNEHVISEK
jgi:hypothetical protein